MNEKFIDEVMGLVARLEGAVEFGNHEQIVWERGAIRAKLRDVVERNPLSDEIIRKEFAGTFHNGRTESCFVLGARYAERAHNIGAK